MMSSVKRRHKTKTLRRRDGDDCWICGHPITFGLPLEHPEGDTLDHVIERSAGGTDHLSNLRLAHRICNHVRSNRTKGIRP